MEYGSWYGVDGGGGCYEKGWMGGWRCAVVFGDFNRHSRMYLYLYSEYAFYFYGVAGAAGIKEGKEKHKAAIFTICVCWISSSSSIGTGSLGIQRERVHMKGQNAYFTVEAALVLPMVMSAMLVGIYLFCYQYDRCLLEQDMGNLLLWSSAMAAENTGGTDEIAEGLRQRAVQINRAKYAAWKLTALDIRLERNNLSITGQGELAFPVPGWNLWNQDNLWDAQVSYESSRLSPVFYIRQYRKLHGVLQKMT